MSHLNNILSYTFRSAFAALLFVFGSLLTSCEESEETTYSFTIAEDQQSISLDWDDTEGSASFAASADWTASVPSSCTWLTLTVKSGSAGAAKLLFVTTENDDTEARETTITIISGTDSGNISVVQNGNEDAARTMDPSEIENYEMFYCPETYNEGFSGGPEAMLRSDSRWSWWRMKQSEHFFVFWEPGFGDDPNASTVSSSMRVDIDDLLEKAEQFYTTNVEVLGMVETGKGQSQLDNYKMEIYLLYQSEWLATGSGYDNVIGALWVNPSTCQPAGSTIAHEIGHSFQYQVSADKLYNGTANLTDYGADAGFRYGYGENGSGGCAYWEQCAQWQSFQDYPDETFGYHISVWQSNHHRSFLHETFRYASYWFQYYMTQKHGIEAFAEVWKESAYPEDPLQAYMRLYCNNDLDTFYDEYFEYVQHCAAYDFDAVHQYATSSAMSYNTSLLVNENGNYQVTYDNCPGTTGFNLIPLNVAADETVRATLSGLEPGSDLLADDPGKVLDGDGVLVETATAYNQQSNKDVNFRFGFVAVDSNGESSYGSMVKGSSGVAEFEVPADAAKLYLAVAGTPDTYNRQAWDDDYTNDEQWPYEVNFENTDLLGNIEIPEGDPEDVTIEHTLTLDSSQDVYELGSMNLLENGDLSEIGAAFRMQPSSVFAKTVARDDVSGDPEDGEIVVGLLQPDGTVSEEY